MASTAGRAVENKNVYLCALQVHDAFDFDGDDDATFDSSRSLGSVFGGGDPHTMGAMMILVLLGLLKAASTKCIC